MSRVAEHFGFVPKAREAIRVACHRGITLIATDRFRLLSVA
jgi:hypothetical protein